MKINFSAPINPTSYGLTGMHILRELYAQGVSVTLYPIPGIHAVQCEQDSDVEIVQKCINRQQQDFDPDAPSLRLWHQFDMAQHVGCGKRFGFTIFETTKFTDNEFRQLEWLDGILVPSKWAADKP